MDKAASTYVLISPPTALPLQHDGACIYKIVQLEYIALENDLQQKTRNKARLVRQQLALRVIWRAKRDK